jgi:hypothetical protein
MVINMAGQSSHNLSILGSRRGAPRFPFERSDAGDGYAGAGPVVSYRLSPEEIAARYGPPSSVKRELTRGAVKWAVEHAGSLKEAAEKLNITEKHLRFEMARHCVAVPEEWEEDEEMETTQENKYVAAITGAVKAAMEENGIPVEIRDMPGDLPSDAPAGMDTAGEDAAPPKKKTRKEILQEKLTREQYVAMKEQGLTDTAVLEQIGQPGWLDVLTLLKRKWGLVGVVFRKAQPEQPENQPQPTNQDAPQDDKNARSSEQEEDGKVIGLTDTYPQACEANAGLVDIMPDNLTQSDIDDEQVEWAVPFVSTRDYPVLVVADDNIRLNSSATCAMLDAGIRSLRIGVAKGRIILKPDNSKDCFKIGRSGKGQKGSSAKLGGRALCNFIASKGVAPGKYALTWNEAKGWWETGGREE